MPGPPAILWHSSAIPTLFPAQQQWTATLTLTQAIPANADVIVLAVIDYGANTAPGNVFSVVDSQGGAYTEYNAWTCVFADSGLGIISPGSHLLWYKLNHPGAGVGSTITVSGYTAAIMHVYVLNGVNAATPINSAVKQVWQGDGNTLHSGMSSGYTAAMTLPNVLLLGGISESFETTSFYMAPGSFSSGEIAAPWILAEAAWYAGLNNYSPPSYIIDATRLVTGYQALAAASGVYSFVTAAGTVSEGYDTGSYPYNEVFVIAINGEVNVAPNAPTLTAQANFDPTHDKTFVWAFFDPNAIDGQTAYQLQILTNPGGVVTYDSGMVSSTVSSAVVPAGSLAPNVAYQWKVRTYDQSAAVGPYSVLSSFSTAVPPVIVITTPVTDGTTSFIATPTFAWTYTSSSGATQQSYRLQVIGPSGTVYDSGVVVSTALTAISGALLTGFNYIATLTIVDSNSLITAMNRVFFVQAPSPAPPLVTAQTSTDKGAIALIITTRS